MPPFRILFHNVGYCTGIDGHLASYMFGLHKYVMRQRKAEEKLAAFLREQDVDVCCLVEVTLQSMFTLHEHLRDCYTQCEAERKYGPQSRLKTLPLFTNRANGFLAKKPVESKAHFLSSGVKKLVQELSLTEDLSLFFGHLSLGASARARQMQELADMVAEKQRVILCGDFNIFDGVRELNPLLERGLKIVGSDADVTFPAWRPRQRLDLFLCSQNVHPTRCDVLHDSVLSDHLPLLLEVEI